MDETKFFLTEDPNQQPQQEQGQDQSLKDIAEFGNQPVQDLSSNGLVYDLVISGLDTPEMRSDLEAVLLDSKLGMPFQSLAPKILDGVLKLDNVHPVKAAVLVSRLRQTNLKVGWKTAQILKKLAVGSLLFFSSWGWTSGAHASEWSRHEGSLKQTTIKINNLQDDIIALSHKRNAEADINKKEELLEEAKKKYIELKNAHRDLLKEMEHVRFEHPEKGDKSLKEYKHVKLKKMEEIENDNSIDGQMLRLKSKAEQKYGAPKRAAEESSFTNKKPVPNTSLPEKSKAD